MKIDSFSFGSISISGKKFSHDVTVSWDGEIRERESNHLFSKAEAIELLMKDPELIIVGCGTAGLMKIDPAAEEAVKKEKIKLLSGKTTDMVQEFNKHNKKKKVVALFHLTC